MTTQVTNINIVDWEITNPKPHILAISLTPRKTFTISPTDTVQLHFLGMHDLFHSIDIDEEFKTQGWIADFDDQKSYVKLNTTASLTLQANHTYEGIRLRYELRRQNTSHRVRFHLQFMDDEVIPDVESHMLDILVFDTPPPHQLSLEVVGPNEIFTYDNPERQDKYYEPYDPLIDPMNETIIRLINTGPRSLVVHRYEAEEYHEGQYNIAELRLLYADKADNGRDKPVEYSHTSRNDLASLVTKAEHKKIQVEFLTNTHDDLAIDTDYFQIHSDGSATDSFWRIDLADNCEHFEILPGQYLQLKITNISTQFPEGLALVAMKLMILDEDLYERTFITQLDRTPVRRHGNGADAKLTYDTQLTVSSWVHDTITMTIDRNALTIDGNKPNTLLTVNQTGTGHSAHFKAGKGVLIDGVTGANHALEINVNTSEPALYSHQSGTGQSAHFKAGKGVLIDGVTGANHALEINVNTSESALYLYQAGAGNSAHIRSGKGVLIDDVKGATHALHIDVNTSESALYLHQQNNGHSANFKGGKGVKIDGVSGQYKSGLTITASTNLGALVVEQTGTGFSGRFKGGNGIKIHDVRDDSHGNGLHIEANTSRPLIFVDQKGNGRSAHFKGGDGVLIDGVHEVDTIKGDQTHALEIRGHTKGQSLIYAHQQGPDHVAHFVGGAGLYIEDVNGSYNALLIKGNTTENHPLVYAKHNGGETVAYLVGNVVIKGNLKVTGKIDGDVEVDTDDWWNPFD